MTATAVARPSAVQNMMKRLRASKKSVGSEKRFTEVESTFAAAVEEADSSCITTVCMPRSATKLVILPQSHEKTPMSVAVALAVEKVFMSLVAVRSLYRSTSSARFLSSDSSSMKPA